MPFVATTVEPAGVSKRCAEMIPAKKHRTEKTAELMTTPKKLLNSFMEMRVGKIMRADISRVPIILMPSTTTIAVRTAIIML